MSAAKQPVGNSDRFTNRSNLQLLQNMQQRHWQDNRTEEISGKKKSNEPD